MASEKGKKLYAWTAGEEEYNRRDEMGEYLRNTTDLKTISEIEKKDKIKKATLVCNLTNELNIKEKQCEEIEKNISKTEASISNVTRQMEDMIKAHNEELEMIHKEELMEIERIYSEMKEKLQLELEIKQIEDKQAEMKKKLDSMEENLKDKAEDLESQEELNKALMDKERRTSEELQDAKKELIEGLQNRPVMNASIGVKRMGDLDHKPIVSAAKRKYTAAEAGEKAMEFASLLDAKMRYSDWYPFKVITVGADSKIVINEEDDFMQMIKNEWGDEVYDTVVTGLTELNECNPSERYPLPELWNFKKGTRATLGESVEFILRLWKTKKRKRTFW